jgi:hypothetical protein
MNLRSSLVRDVKRDLRIELAAVKFLLYGIPEDTSAEVRVSLLRDLLEGRIIVRDLEFLANPDNPPLTPIKPLEPIDDPPMVSG